MTTPSSGVYKLEIARSNSQANTDDCARMTRSAPITVIQGDPGCGCHFDEQGKGCYTRCVLPDKCCSLKCKFPSCPKCPQLNCPSCPKCPEIQCPECNCPNWQLPKCPSCPKCP
eukprot:Selendium_serpulae@DN6468_c0_g1_i2.p1